MDLWIHLRQWLDTLHFFVFWVGLAVIGTGSLIYWLVGRVRRNKDATTM